MPPARRYLAAAEHLATDLGRWYRGESTSSDTYRLARRVHRYTAGWSSVAARNAVRAMPCSPDRLGSLDHPRLDPAGSEALASLRRDGVTMLPPVLAADAVASLVAFAEQAPASGRMASGETRTGTYEELRGDAAAVYLDGRFAWARPEVQQILVSEAIWELARAYFGMVPVVHPPQLYWSCASAPDDPAQAPSLARNFHWDYDGIGGMRVHLYLTDVDDTAAPMEYVVGSHRPGTLNTPDLRRADDGEAPEAALDALGLRERRAITGPAGTTFVSDSSGLHRATRPTGRDRLFLVMPLRAGGYGGYYSRRRSVPVRDERFGAALAAGRPELRLFVPAGDDARVVTLAEQAAS
jgi:hypothetical protein